MSIPSSCVRFFTPGNRVTMLTDTRHCSSGDEDLFTQVERCIDAATDSIQIDMYALDKADLVARLKAKAAQGVRVQVITSPTRATDYDQSRAAAMEELRQAGVSVRVSRSGQIDHVKLLLVDGHVAVIGGMNWGGHSAANHDYDVLVEGPVVQDMRRFFRQDWLISGGQATELPTLPTPRPDSFSAGTVPVNFLTTSPTNAVRTAGPAVHRAICAARRSIHAELFVLTERPTIQALQSAHTRGVEVKVILHPLKIGDRPINESAWHALAAAGVDVRWYDGDVDTQEKLHAKMAIFDGNEVIVGSANWSHAGFNTNREASVDIDSPQLGARFEACFQKDWATSTTVTPHYVESVPPPATQASPPDGTLAPAPPIVGLLESPPSHPPGSDRPASRVRQEPSVAALNRAVPRRRPHALQTTLFRVTARPTDRKGLRRSASEEIAPP